MEGPQQPLRARVQRKGRFTITEIAPGSPQDAASTVFQDADAQTAGFDDGSGEGDYDTDMAVAVAVGQALDHNQALADTSLVVVQQQQIDHVQAQQMELSPSQPPAAPTTPLLQPQSPEEDVVLGKALPLIAAAPVQEPPSLVVVATPATDPVVEPEPSPALAPIEIPEPQQQQQQQLSPALVDHVFIEYDNDSSDSDTAVQLPLPASIEEVPHQQLSPVPPSAKSSLTIDVNISETTATVQDVAAAIVNVAAQSPPLQQDDDDDGASTRVKRKSRFTITELTSESPRSRENSNELFDQSSYSTVSAYSAEFSASQQFTSSEFGSTTTTGGVFSSDYESQPSQDGLVTVTTTTVTATASQDQYDDQQQQVQQQDESELQRMTRSLPSTLSPSLRPSSRRSTTRSVSPARQSLEMIDLARESSGGADESAAEQQERESLRYHRERTWSTVGVSGHDSETNGSSHTPASYFANSSLPLPSPIRVNGNGSVRRGLFGAENDNGSEARGRHTGNGSGLSSGSSGRRHASSRQKSITISAAQFLQQQQTIAALIRQQQELKHIIGVLQEQQQQLMSVPVQLHELRLENAKGDGKDEMMRELYVQVDSLMRANDSLQVLVTQAEKESQDRSQEAEFLTEENDQLRARCHYFERKYIEERKLTFVLEEEVQRFRMMSLTHELEQRNSVSQDGPLSSSQHALTDRE